ncbi:MAG: glutamate-1-semialdehyde 2,1-aminomutase [Candidatus Schekmanbacteria bacterium]|nr:glutamate-1-semialdehyde 2,1-aminomutase [Candidatus Schekmanbacteria bacterium]
MERIKSQELFSQAKKIIPGGVNSPVRAFKAVGGNPVYIDHGQGSKIYDVDGKEYIDYVCSWGPLILGHAHPQILAALQKAMAKGTSFGAPTERETEFASMLINAVPSMEMVRLVNSGTEATMSALRLARGFTGRNKIVKFEGCYHGHVDSLLVKAGSGAATLGTPDSAGVSVALAQDTITLPYNDLKAVKELFSKHGGQIAALIVEPVAGNMGLVLPKEGFLEGLRQITAQHDSLLIFDEVITGFRVSFGGAQGFYGIKPDLTCLGKIIGGGLPVGAYGGKEEIMKHIAPLGAVYQAGTLAGNPLAVSAGIETLKILSKPGTYEVLAEKGAYLSLGLQTAARQAKIPVCAAQVGSLLGLFFTPNTVTDWGSASTSNTTLFARYFSSMLKQGVYLAPSQYESSFISTAHNYEDLDKTIATAECAFQSLGTGS